MAVFRASRVSALRLKFATAGPLTRFRRTQSIPAMTPLSGPDPEQSRTFTGVITAFLATPYVAPAIVPATWVPCPLQSVVPSVLSIDDEPGPTRPPNSPMFACTPVSNTYTVTPCPAESG